jgi:hypothetical protein
LLFALGAGKAFFVVASGVGLSVICAQEAADCFRWKYVRLGGDDDSWVQDCIATNFSSVTQQYPEFSHASLNALMLLVGYANGLLVQS